MNRMVRANRLYSTVSLPIRSSYFTRESIVFEGLGVRATCLFLLSLHWVLFFYLGYMGVFITCV
jgi:hypothetical protein